MHAVIMQSGVLNLESPCILTLCDQCFSFLKPTFLLSMGGCENAFRTPRTQVGSFATFSHRREISQKAYPEGHSYMYPSSFPLESRLHL